jgi:multidrug resistance efflux pump
MILCANSTSRPFAQGGNFSREEIENYQKQLEKAEAQIEKVDVSIVKEMEKIEKKKLDDANKTMQTFQER